MMMLLFYCIVSITTTSAFSFQVIDLSHELKGETLRWPKHTSLSLLIKHKGLLQSHPNHEEKNFWLKINDLTGTHLHAPGEFNHHRWSLDEIPPSRFIGSGEFITVSNSWEGTETLHVSIIDLREKVRDNPDYEISTADIQQWESHQRARLEPLVIFWTGWASHWASKERYFGTSINDSSLLHFPGLHPDAAQWLVNNRQIHGVGIDVMSIDYGQAKRLTVHHILADKNIFLMENVNTNELNSTLLFHPLLVVSPLKISAGSVSPVRPLLLNVPSRVGVSFLQIRHVFIIILSWMIIVTLFSAAVDS